MIHVDPSQLDALSLTAIGVLLMRFESSVAMSLIASTLSCKKSRLRCVEQMAVGIHARSVVYV